MKKICKLEVCKFFLITATLAWIARSSLFQLSVPAFAGEPTPEKTWPVVTLYDANDPVRFMAPPTFIAPPRDGAEKIYTGTDISGRLVYVQTELGTLYNTTLRNFNIAIPNSLKNVPLISFSTRLDAPNLRTGAYFLTDFALDNNGESLHFLASRGGTPPPQPLSVPVHWNFDNGAIRYAPREMSRAYDYGVRGMIQGPHQRSPDKRFLAYWWLSKSGGMNGSDEFALAFSSSNDADKIVGVTLNPSPGYTNIAWTPHNNLLYAFAPNFPYRNWDLHLSAPDYSHDPRNSGALLPSQLWPSIYEADAKLARGKKTLIAKRLIANSFAPIPSPDNRFVLFIGWGRDTPVPTPKKGQNSSVASSEPRWWVWDRQSKTRTLIAKTPRFYNEAVWSNDSKRVFFAANAASTCDVSVLDVDGILKRRYARSEEAVKVLAKLPLASAGANGKDLQVRLRAQSKDNQRVFVDTMHREGEAKIDTIWAIVLKTSQVETVARLRDVESYDWWDGSQSTNAAN